MFIRESYCCGYCGSQYADRESAMRCESFGDVEDSCVVGDEVIVSLYDQSHVGKSGYVKNVVSGKLLGSMLVKEKGDMKHSRVWFVGAGDYEYMCFWVGDEFIAGEMSAVPRGMFERESQFRLEHFKLGI